MLNTFFRRNYIKRILLISLTLLILTPVTAYIGPYHIAENTQYIKTTAKCSCSLSIDYQYHTMTWLNYCPNCHHYYCLRVEVGSGQDNPEGMIYCQFCDMDYCLVHGKSHDNRYEYLVQYKTQKQPIMVEKSKKELFFERFNSLFSF